MPGGGFYAFVTYGSQNVLLSSNPHMTYFYKVFRKYTHFSEESFTVPVDGPNQLAWDKPIQIRAKLPRNADLVRDLYFVFTLPDIYSKFVDNTQRRFQYNFQWSRYIGCRLIDRVSIFIGGQKIQEFDGSYLVAKANLDLESDALRKWEYLVGHQPELYDPANSATAAVGSAGTIQGLYPTVVQSVPLSTTLIPTQVNRPSVFGRDIYVPIPFWCTEDPSLSLPLCALQLQEVEIQLTLRPVQELYTILDPSGYRVAPGYKMDASISQYNLGLPTYSSDIFNETTNNWNISNFLVDIGYSTPTLETIPYNPRILATYVYLSDEERKTFATTPLQYLVYQVNSVEQTLSTRDYIRLEISNPITRLITVPRRTDAIQYRNNEFNWTNWINDVAPYNSTPTNVFSPPAAPGNPPASEKSSGLLIPAGQQDIIRGLQVICDGNVLQDERTTEYFRKLVPYKYYKGANSLNCVPYPFSIKQSAVQPSGSINASRIKNFQVDVNVFPLPLSVNNVYTYVYNITVYIEAINWVLIQNGTGGLKYAT